jgi:TolA-binding protein
MLPNNTADRKKDEQKRTGRKQDPLPRVVAELERRIEELETRVDELEQN